jgi:hypothetical protein
VLEEFPVSEISVQMPSWTTVLDENHRIRASVRESICRSADRVQRIGDVKSAFASLTENEYVEGVETELLDLGSGRARIALKMAEHRLNENILYIRTAKVGDLAWLDENSNGLLDGSERRLPGVKVQLLQDGEPVYETQTDLFGYYQFDHVYPGSYTLRAVAYDALTITKPVPALRIISSCLTAGDGVSAQSDPFTVESGCITNDFDLGYVLLPGQKLPALEEAPAKDWSMWNAQYSSMQD